MEEKNTNNIIKIIDELKLKYIDNPYMIQRLETHLTNLPNMLENEHKRYDERVSRFNELTLEHDNFHKVFLSKHQYFYMPYNNIYYEYDGKTFKIIKDDDIHYQLLTTITDEGKLIQWKHKTKQNIIKKIKERSLFKATPETYTIQNVFGFLQTIFETKTETKYFLTLLGDCVLKKNNDNLLYFVSSNLKKIIALIDTIVYVTIGSTIMNNFITKYHDSHKLLSYRLIKEKNTLSNDIVKNVLNNIGIDLLCVATHYSERYTNADNYLTSKCDDEIKNYIWYFVKTPIENIIDYFIEQCIENVSIGNIIFKNITSKYLPSVSSFLLFWDKYITIVTDTNNDDEYEIDELMTLYKGSEYKSTQISDTNMIKMIYHYFSPQVDIIDNKYITNIKCNLWSKHDDLNEFLNSYKLNNNYEIEVSSNTDINLISFDELYQSYKLIFKAKTIIDQKNYPIVSKNFFEKYLTNNLTNYIKFDKFVSSEWLLQE